jgi:hypothetical protein
MNGISVKEGLEFCKEIKDLDLLPVAIADAYNKHWNNEKISPLERFLCGLAYSEFYADEPTDAGYCRASDKRNGYLKKIGIENSWELIQKVEKLLR